MSTVLTDSNIGRPVRFRLGNLDYEGTIVGERQVGRSRVFSIEVGADPYEPMTFEVPQSDVQFAPQAPQSTLTLEQIIEFFGDGGLVSILRTNSGGRNQPRVWLRNDSRGNVTYTFDSERGVIGGEIVPFGTLEGEVIFLPKKDVVQQYLHSFGLTDGQADFVISAVGTAS